MPPCNVNVIAHKALAGHACPGFSTPQDLLPQVTESAIGAYTRYSGPNRSPRGCDIGPANTASTTLYIRYPNPTSTLSGAFYSYCEGASVEPVKEYQALVRGQPSRVDARLRGDASADVEGV